MQMYMSKPRLGVVTAAWANRPSASTVGALFFATDVGENGTLMIATGSRWRPMNGSAALATRTAATSAIANSETNTLQTLIPAGLLQAGDVIRLKFIGTKSGSTDSYHLTVRVGTAGTTGDTALTGLSAYVLMNASGLAGGAEYDVGVVSATSMQKLGPNTAATTSYSNPNAAANQTAATTVTDASANALYVSLNVLSSGTTNTVTVQSGQILLITP